ncbi:ABC transporter permease [Dyadobacter sp. CY343]|uniref:ABC transporter permease n=1 Tax=Dyadobacter sp. CY343 TaxID=2907299 RepID=UPI001F465104|nr:ABC transporter permease [Dyadobacter sp. CY343]MCE7063118.1 permease prefix domain 2-containing transporter [Dyadobacter sp. CY343]
MKQQPKATPPRWATRFLHWYCRPRLLEDLEGDLNEYFERNVARKGVRSARLIYILDVLKFLRPYTIRKIEFFHFFIHWIMIGSYFKTSRRSLVRNKLFSLINIVGLAVSMSVGLLVISIVSDLYSYDDFQDKKDRTYRIITKTVENGQTSETNLASTSIRVGEKIKESIPAIEYVTAMRAGFSGDAKVGNSTVPIEATWADNSFLKVFRFPLLKGDLETALKEPQSLVLTEKTAEKLFGESDALGKTVRFDSTIYTVTGVVQNIPKLSHINFQALISLASIDAGHNDADLHSWANIWQNYVYVTFPETIDATKLQPALDRLSKQENKTLTNRTVSVSMQPMKDIVLGGSLMNNIGPTFAPPVMWTLCGLAIVVILSACFNYTNLSVARSMRRSREVGIRKIIGAQKSHVLGQFMAESVIIALLALVFSFALFMVLRKEFLDLDKHIADVFSLNISIQNILYFILLAVITGIAAGLMPALFFSKMNALHVMKDASSMKIFRRVGIRKVLIVVQFTLSLIFIAATLIGYNQYKGLVTFNLGFKTENIINLRLQGNKGNVLAKEIAQIPAVKGISQSMMITSLGSKHGTNLTYETDSSLVWENQVDEHYLPLHQHQFLAGQNFTARPEKGKESEIIVNQQVLKKFNIGDQNPEKALGKIVSVSGQQLAIVGVVKDFHYGSLENRIEPVMFRYSSEPDRYLNVKIVSQDLPATLESIQKVWRKVDKVHELDAKIYDEQIEEAYAQFSLILKIIGVIAFLAICIASLGLFGMVVFTTETKLKEISIRKVLGASETGLIYLLCKGFLLLLVISTVIALPVTYLFFDKVVLTKFPYHQAISISDMLGGSLIVMLLAFFLIGSQTVKAARNNPAKVLKSE